jgi:hypothetical protein
VTGKKLLSGVMLLHGSLRYVQEQLKKITDGIDEKKVREWAEKTVPWIEKIFLEFDMGQAATTINNLLSQITALNGQLAAAQANALDTADNAAIAAGNNEFTAFQQSQTPPATPAPTAAQVAAAPTN